MPKQTQEVSQDTLNRLIRESHRRQFGGQDFQTVAVDLAAEHDVPFESFSYTAILSGPEPGCECGFCRTAPWRD